ncbi:hypothetical protein [Sphingomonas hengshuiensis]|uniref:hypothetical protein n=1 Tax=Sphingomonas hengshuiensis TaxID=1609977 RepID=UPI0012B713F0|nr:hypothetical protein [Sphingomonas hengshuiensis]
MSVTRRSVPEARLGSKPDGTRAGPGGSQGREFTRQEVGMGKGILLWLVGIPIPIILLLLIFWH